jgi:polyisoprenoid-binding protein YceI
MTKIKWALDPTHSEINFKIKHLMITNVSGSFSKFDASIESDDDNFTNSVVSFSADVNSINTNNEQRDGHLKSGDFFNAETYPTIKFESTKFEKSNDGNFSVSGDLTIKDVTKSVTLDVELGGITKDPWGNTKAGFTITGKINRTHWNLSWNAALETGGVMVSEEVKINAEVQFVKQAQ